MMFKKSTMPSKESALPGRDQLMVLSNSRHYVNQRDILPPWPEGYRRAMFGMGCFWGAERLFWQTPGVWITAAGYAGGYTPNPLYSEVCTGQTGHNEVVFLVFNPEEVNYSHLLHCFWQGHDPTQYMRQGNDVGTQYRSGIYTYDDTQIELARQSKAQYQHALSDAGRDEIATEILPAGEFYYAEDAHQQYLAKNPGGYCGLGGTGVCYPPQVSDEQ